MKKVLISTVLFLCLFSSTVFTQNKDDETVDLIWSRIKLDPKGEIIQNDNYQYTPAPQVIRKYSVNGIETIIYPNFRPFPTTNSTQSETSVDVHPTNPDIVFASANATPSPVAGIYGTGIYYTTNGGTNWSGFDDPPFGRNSGDPAAVIGTNGNFYIGYIDGGTNDGGQGVSVSTNNGQNWSRYVVAAAPAGFNDLLDKNHMWVDKKPGSPYENRVYAAWTDFISGNPNNYKVALVYSTNNGQTWSNRRNISTGLANSYLDQGVNIATGPNGEVYAAWAVYNASPVTNGEDGIGFNVSTNGGETWGTPKYIYNVLNFGIRGNLSNKANIRVASFPSMAVNRNTGEIFIVFPQKANIAPSGNSIDIVMIKSTDGGTTWGNPVRVNDDPMNNGKDQYYPWCTVDQTTGAFHVVFYDSRNVANDSAEVYMASSIDGGATFQNYKVTDAKFKPKTISGLASGYQGDYIGITALNNIVYPYWCDDRTGIYQGWMTKVVFATYPLNPFNLTAPEPNISLLSFPNSNLQYTFNWDTSASTASYKWMFLNSQNNRLIVLNASSNQLKLTAGQLDILLENLGVNQGDSLVGFWNVMAFRNNLPDNDSLISANGPRPLVLKRGVPELLPFSLSTPANNVTIVTSVNNTSQIKVTWTRSGEGVKYKWKFRPDNNPSTTLLDLSSDNNGFDTVLTVSNNALDGILGGIGLGLGDSLMGKWSVFAFRNPTDSLQSQQIFNITLKRQALGDVLIVFDSTSANGRLSRDSVVNALNTLEKTYDFRNRGGNTSTTAFSMRGYKYVVWLGAGTSIMSNIQKDSVKQYMLSGGTNANTKSKFIVFGEDVGYHFDRTASTYIDTSFARSWLGFVYVLDRPASGANQGLINIITGQTDSTVGSWPDVIRHPGYGITHSLYRYRGINSFDSVNAIGKISPNYNTAVFCSDVHALRNANDGPGGSPITRLLNRAILFVDEQVVPVEFTAFTAQLSNETVNLYWETATELNNYGFEVERRSAEGVYSKIGFISGAGTSTEVNKYSFVDLNVISGEVFYRIKQIDYDGTISYSDQIQVMIDLPLEFALLQNYPNPFNPSTTIKYSIPKDEFVNLSIYNTLGEKVYTLVNEIQKSGKYQVDFNAKNLSSGVYFYRLESGSNLSIKKMLLLK